MTHPSPFRSIKTLFPLLLSYPNFVQGQLFVDIRVFAGHVELLRANCHVIRKISQCFGSK